MTITLNQSQTKAREIKGQQIAEAKENQISKSLSSTKFHIIDKLKLILEASEKEMIM